MKLITRSLIIALLSSLYATTSLACENHAFPSFGIYSHKKQWPYEDYDRSETSPTHIVLKHSRYTSAKLDEQKVINIDYQIPDDFSLATLEVSSRNNIEFEPKGKIILEDSKGNYKLAYTAKSSGSHVIEIKAEAIKEGKPYTKVQKIYLSAK